MGVLEGPRIELRRILLGGSPTWVKVVDDVLVAADGRRIAEHDAVYLAPCDPTQIICVHLNYVSRAKEFGADLEGRTPTYFQKPVASLNAHGGDLLKPEDCHYLNYEGEIAAIVGKPMKNVTPDEVWDCLAGFAPANDVGCHDFRDTDSGSMLRVKGMDSFCPVGPGIVSGIDIHESTVRTYLNGALVQEGAVSEMVWGIDYLLADLARYLTFLPGDVVLTGTPWYSRPMDFGDVVEVEVDGIGRLRNTVVPTPAVDRDVGFRPNVSKQSAAVALGKDYRRMRDERLGDTPGDYFRQRDDFLALCRAEGP